MIMEQARKFLNFQAWFSIWWLCVVCPYKWGVEKQLAAVLSGHGPAGAVIVGGVADGIVGDSLSVKGGQQIGPI